MYYIGIDLGTSAVKLLLVDQYGKIIKSAVRDYPLYFPHPGWSEQDPQDWWNAVTEGVKELLQGIDTDMVRAIGCGGQMHGLVALDQENRVIRPAILWNDGRTEKEVDYLNNTVGKDCLSARTGNIAFAGFTAPKILWMRNNEPENFDRIAKIMLPKDYINYRLTGVFSSDYSDASGTLLLDVAHKRWSDEMLQLCGIRPDQMPQLFESFEVTGTLLPDVAEKLGLHQTVKVVAGAGDNAAAAVGTGTVSDGSCNISLGTSGTIFISSRQFKVDSFNALHAFAHANAEYHLMGCILSAASCNKWFCEEILKTDDYKAEQAGITDEKLGRNRVFFLPYLMGERSPINDTNARGTFTGLSMDSSRQDMLQAVLEGVSFAVRDCFEVAKSLHIPIQSSRICGGGAKSVLWRKMIANILNIRLVIPKAEEGPGFGGAMLAMVGDGVYPSVGACSDSLVKTAGVIEPDPAIAARYEAQYQKYRALYPALKEAFKTIR